MPAKSKQQQKLMGWSYACKTNKSKYCPPNIKKVADSMSKKDLKDFAETKHTNLPEKVKESIIYKVEKVNNTLYNMFKDWLIEKNVQFIENQNHGELEILNNYDLNEEDQHQLLSYIQKIGLKKVLEDFGAPGSGAATLANTIGVGAINPPGPGKTGSGDRFDNAISAGGTPTDWLKVKKKKGTNSNEPKQKYVKSLTDFLKDKKRKNK